MNSLAPYILTCLMERPARLIYLSSSLHYSGDPKMDNDFITWKSRSWSGYQAYNDTKLHNVILANAVARAFGSAVRSNSVDPGWQPTAMGGKSAPGDLDDGVETQAWLATSDDATAGATGKYFLLKKERKPHAAATDHKVQDAYIKACEELSGVKLPH